MSSPEHGPESGSESDAEVSPELEQEFSDACNAIFRVLKRGRGDVGRRADGKTLSEAQVAMLESVAQRGPLSVGAIARYAGLAQPTVSRMLNTLERQDIIRRSSAPHDERTVLVDLTDEGRVLWKAKRELLRYFQRDALLRFAPERRRAVVNMLRELVEIVEDQITER